MVVILQAIRESKPEAKHVYIVTFLFCLEIFGINEGIQRESRAEKDSQQCNAIQPFTVRVMKRRQRNNGRKMYI